MDTCHPSVVYQPIHSFAVAGRLPTHPLVYPAATKRFTMVHKGALVEER
jgi:hypothetical protein